MAKNPVVHFEIGCRELTKTREFYSGMFAWNFNDHFQVAEETAGLAGHLVSLGHEPYNYTIFYVRVDDVKAYIDKALELGGKKLVGPVTIPTGVFAWIRDPEGNVLGLWKDAA
jgi:predicted enzyme related to lactoylglutathione lyase